MGSAASRLAGVSPLPAGGAILVFCLAALAAFAIAACDFSPSSPFEGFEEEQRQGATLTGTFRGSGATAVGTSAQLTLGGTYAAESTVASASEYDVATVVVLDEKGDEIASVDVVDDSFTLRGLPESFSLVFLDAKGVQLGDPMEFDGVKPNQEIDIVVDVVEGKVVLLEESRTGIDHPGSAGIELDGAATNITFDRNSDRMTGSLDVDGRHVVTRSAETSIRKGNLSMDLSDIEKGDQVHVRGVYEGADVFAFEIKLQEDDEEEVANSGTVTICHIPPGNPENRKTKEVDASAVCRLCPLASRGYTGRLLVDRTPMA